MADDRITGSPRAQEYPLGQGGEFYKSPDYPEPLKIVIGNIPCDNPGVSWQVIPGIEPYQIKLRFPNSRMADVQKLRKGYKDGLTLTVSAWNVVLNKKEELVVNNLFLLPSEPFSDVYYEVPLTNCMYWYRYFTWTKRYNMRRVANDLETVDTQGLYTFRKDKYLDYSLNPEGKPWTALEILVDVLNGLNAQYNVDWFDAGSVKGIVENNYIPDDREYIRTPAVQIIRELLGMAYCGIKCDKDGKVRLYRLDAKPFEGIDTTTLVQQDDTSFIDYSAKRPEAINVGFVPFKEVWLQTDPNEEQGFGATAVVQSTPRVGLPYIYNVMPIPTNISKEAVVAAWGSIDQVALGRYGEAYKTHGVVRGTWLPIRTAIEFRAAQDAIDGAADAFSTPMVPINGNMPAVAGYGGGEPLITRCYYAGLLEIFYGMSRAGAPSFWNVTRMRWCNAIRQHLFKTYRIWPEYMEQILSWEPVRAGYIDPVYRQMLNSPVYTEYAVIPNVFPPPDLLPLSKQQVSGQNYDDYSLITTTLGKMFGRVSKLGKFSNPKVAELFGDDLDVIRVSPFRVDVVDERLGIFRLTEEEDLEGIAARIEPAQLQNLDILVLGQNGSVLDGNMWLKNRKKVKLVVSIIPANPNSDGQLYYEDGIKPEQFGHKAGTAPVQNIMCAREMARFSVYDTDAINVNTLRDIAKAEAITLFTSYRDRTAGILTYQGFANKAELSGFQRGINYTAGPGGLYTYQDFTEDPEPPPFYSLVGQDTRKLLYRAIWSRG